MPAKSSRWCAPRLSVRSIAACVTTRATVSMLRRSSQSRRVKSNGTAAPNGRAPSIDSSLSICESARSSLACVRKGPTSSDMMVWSVSSIAAVFGASWRSSPRSRSSVSRTSEAVGARIAFAREAAVRPAWRPNTRASVIALPESRLAPFAPPTASPATRRPGTTVSIRAFATTPPM
jgi:hypothetical protein